MPDTKNPNPSEKRTFPNPPFNTQPPSPKKQYFLQKTLHFQHGIMLGFVLIFAVIGTYIITNSFAAAPTHTATPTYTPMTVTKDDFSAGQDPQGIKAMYKCIGTDDDYYWTASGSLKPGESYTFTPDKPICSKNEARFISANASWDASTIELTTNNPVSGSIITGAQTGSLANVCSLNDVNFSAGAPPTLPYSVTIKNVGTQTAYKVSLNGQSHNGWMNFVWPTCFWADAEHDGWNDASEYVMTLIGPSGYSPPLNDRVFYSDYYRASGTPTNFDERDFYPPDIDNDGNVTQADYDLMNRYIGQGDGHAIDNISPNQSDPNYSNINLQSWRRFDLNGDGYVNQLDLAWEQKLIGTVDSYGAATDVLAPRVVIRSPASSSTVYVGSQTQIFASVLDNGRLSNVEYFVNGIKLDCQPFNLTPRGNEDVHGPFACNWTVPKKTGAIYTISVKAMDSGGNITSESVGNIRSIR